MDFVAAVVLASAGTFAGAIGASALVAGVVAGLVSPSSRRDVVHASGFGAVPATGGGSTPTPAQAAPAAGRPGATTPADATGPGPVRDALEAELRERRSEIARIEERLLAKEEAIDARANELARREKSLEDRARNLEHLSEGVKRAKQEHVRELERIAN